MAVAVYQRNKKGGTKPSPLLLPNQPDSAHADRISIPPIDDIFSVPLGRKALSNAVAYLPSPCALHCTAQLLAYIKSARYCTSIPSQAGAQRWPGGFGGWRSFIVTQIPRAVFDNNHFLASRRTVCVCVPMPSSFLPFLLIMFCLQLFSRPSCTRHGVSRLCHARARKSASARTHKTIQLRGSRWWFEKFVFRAETVSPCHCREENYTLPFVHYATVTHTHTPEWFCGPCAGVDSVQLCHQGCPFWSKHQRGSLDIIGGLKSARGGQKRRARYAALRRA